MPVLLVRSPTDISITWANVVPGWALVVLIMIVRCTSATTIRELWKHKFITHESWRVHVIPRATQGGHECECLWEGESKCMSMDLELCLYRGQGWGATNFASLLLFGEFNTWEWEPQHRKGKASGWSNRPFSRSPRTFLKGEIHGQSSLAFYPAVRYLQSKKLIVRHIRYRNWQKVEKSLWKRKCTN